MMVYAQAPVLVTGPATALLTTTEAKAQLRVDGSDEDTLIGALVQAATDYLDGYSGVLGRALVTQTWSQSFTRLQMRIPLPLAPVQSVTSITYYDGDGDSQTFAASNYRLLKGPGGPFIEVDDDVTLPDTDTRGDAATVTFVAGYGDAASDVPQAIRHAALFLVSHWFEHRVPVMGNAPVALPMAVQSLLTPYRRGGL